MFAMLTPDNSVSGDSGSPELAHLASISTGGSRWQAAHFQRTLSLLGLIALIHDCIRALTVESFCQPDTGWGELQAH